MSYFHGLEVAMSAGIDLSIGDFVFEFDNTVLDFSESDVMNIYWKALTGYDIISYKSLETGVYRAEKQERKYKKGLAIQNKRMNRMRRNISPIYLASSSIASSISLSYNTFKTDKITGISLSRFLPILARIRFMLLL